MKTYIYLTNRQITVDENNIVISSNVSTNPIGKKVDLSFIKAVGYKELKDSKRIAIKIKESK